MGLIPLKKYLLVEPLPDNEVKSGNIVLVSNNPLPVVRARVVSAGYGCHFYEGEVVIYRRHDAVEVGQGQFLVHEKSVIAIAVGSDDVQLGEQVGESLGQEVGEKVVSQ